MRGSPIITIPHRGDGAVTKAAAEPVKLSIMLEARTSWIVELPILGRVEGGWWGGEEGGQVARKLFPLPNSVHECIILGEPAAFGLQLGQSRLEIRPMPYVAVMVAGLTCFRRGTYQEHTRDDG